MSNNIPDFMKRELKLPSWAQVIADPISEKGRVSVVIEADPDGFVPEWLKLIGAPEGKPDQYWIECAFQCAKMDLQKALEGTEFQPSLAGKPAEFRIKNRPTWALHNYQKGAGVEAASAGQRVVKAGTEPSAPGSAVLTARAHYIKVRGSLPNL